MKMESNLVESCKSVKASNMPKLYGICSRIREEIRVLCGLNDSLLEEASTELGVDYDLWCADYAGPELADPFMGFCEMLRDPPCPWASIEESSLNGLTLAQFHLAWAFGCTECASWILDSSSPGVPGDLSNDDAACLVNSATRALMHAKSLLGSSMNCLGQKAWG
jgi:hypothetical protein